MGGKTRRGEATQERRLHPERRTCPDCGQVLRMGYVSWRKVATLEGLVRLKVSIGRCENRACARCHRPYHPAEEGRWVLPHYEYGLDVVALIGALRYRDHTSAPQIHDALLARHVQISQRNVQYLLERYDELVALSVRDDPSRRARLVDDLKQAAGPAWEADRHAKKELKKRVRGIRPVERAVAGRDDALAQVVQGDCAAVRGALTDEGKAPLEPGGLQLHARLEAITASLERAEQKRGAYQNPSRGCTTSSSRPSPPPPSAGRVCS